MRLPKTLRIRPIDHPLDAAVCVPGSKSLTNRALLIAALADGSTTLSNALFSDDSYYFARALLALGFDLRLNEAEHTMTVVGQGGRIPAKKATLNIGNAGTAARFLSAFLTLADGEYVLDGNQRMRQRPIGDLVSALTRLGADIRATDGCPPLRISAQGLNGGRTQVAGNISSQFLSALLMIAPYAQTPTEIEVTSELNSKPYVDMTLAVMRDFGVHVTRDGYSSFAAPRAVYRPPHAAYAIESDASAASYFFAAPAVCGGTATVKNISRKSVQGDAAFLDVLKKMRCDVIEEENSISVRRFAPLIGVDVDMRDIPDTAQTLAAIAPFATSPTRIRGIASARVKETDRVRAVCAELTRLGVDVEEHADGMTVYPPTTLRPATVQTYDDHRMAMAFSLIGLRFDGVIIDNPSCVAKTFPHFFKALEDLR